MSIIDLSNVNDYPYIKRFAVTTTAQEITIPKNATKITFGSIGALYFANIGEDGDAFGVDITDYCFVPANNLISINMEIGRQSNRSLLIAMQSGSGHVNMIIEKDK